MFGRRRLVVSRYQPVLGTVLDLRIGAASPRLAARAEATILAEFDRLEGLLSAFRPTSDFCRWRHDPSFPLDPAVLAVLAAAAHWQQRTQGVFNPAVGLLSARWRRAEASTAVPSAEELAELAAAISEPRFVVDDFGVHQTGDCRELNMNAFAKGWIVDAVGRVVSAAFELDSLMINCGGDLVHMGRGSCHVAIENPAAVYDNARPAATVRVSNGGLATSGSARRGFVVGERRFSHVIDPRSGQPVGDLPSVSVLAPDCATADVVATTVAVLGPEAGCGFVDSIDGLTLAAFFVRLDGSTRTSANWPNQGVTEGNEPPSTAR